ncbi:MAG: DUF4173 domain-containing protein [Clostridia bacterium]|nr:DUF4173 domain-containing protein [Clostridia bacterium]
MEEKKLDTTIGTNSLVKSTTRDLVFAAILLVFSVLAVSFTLWGGFSLGFSISYLLFFIISTVYLYPAKKIDVFSMFCGFLSLAASAIFGIYRDSAINFWLFVGMVICTAVYFIGFCNTARFWSGGYLLLADVARTVVVVPFANIAKMFRSLFGNENPNVKKLKGFYKVGIGLLVAIPALIVIVPLLISSDAAFEGFIDRFFSNTGELIAQMFLGSIIAPIIISLLFALKKDLDKPESDTPASVNLHIVDSAIINTFLTVISLCYLTYLFTQLAYFFNAFSGLLPENYTVTQYARRGFFEMCTIAVINMIIIFASLVLLKRKENKTSVVTKILCCFIILFTMVIISTSFSKMYLYMETYGLTRLRVLTSCFMVVLFILFILALIRIFATKFPYMKVALAVGFSAIIIVGFADVDRVVSKYDVEQYKAGALPELDIGVFEDMSDSCVPYLIELMNYDDGPLSYAAREELSSRFEAKFTQKDGKIVPISSVNDFRSYNYAKTQADKLLLQYADELAPLYYDGDYYEDSYFDE